VWGYNGFMKCCYVYIIKTWSISGFGNSFAKKVLQFLYCLNDKLKELNLQGVRYLDVTWKTIGGAGKLCQMYEVVIWFIHWKFNVCDGFSH